MVRMSRSITSTNVNTFFKVKDKAFVSSILSIEKARNASKLCDEAAAMPSRLLHLDRPQLASSLVLLFVVLVDRSRWCTAWYNRFGTRSSTEEAGRAF